MKLPNPIEFELCDTALWRANTYVIEFVECIQLYGALYKLEIYNKEAPAFRIRGEWMSGCCIEGVKEGETVDHILTAAETALFKAYDAGKIIFED